MFRESIYRQRAGGFELDLGVDFERMDELNMRLSDGL